MDKQKLNELADHIDELHRESPEKFNMKEYEICNSPACIAGHTVHYFEPEKFLKNVAGDEDVENLHDLAAEILDLASDTAFPLFIPRHPKAYDATAAQGAKVLRLLAKTEKVKWEEVVKEG